MLHYPIYSREFYLFVVFAFHICCIARMPSGHMYMYFCLFVSLELFPINGCIFLSSKKFPVTKGFENYNKYFSSIMFFT